MSEVTTEVDQKDVFLCHSKSDVDWVHKLATRIEQETWQGRRLSVAFDEWDVRPGENALLRLGGLLQKSRFVAIALSPELVSSEFCTFEWSNALYDDPAGIRGRIIPMIVRSLSVDKLRRLEIPYTLRILNRLNFERNPFTHEYTKLICRVTNRPLPRGRGGNTGSSAISSTPPPVTVGLPLTQESADPVEEVLLSNLLPVTQFPGTIWSAKTALRTKADLWKHLTDKDARGSVPPFILKENRIFTFADLATLRGSLPPFVDERSLRSDAAGQWQVQEDRWRWYVELLHAALRNYLRGTLHLAVDNERHRFFFAPDHGNARTYRPRGAAARTVAKPCKRPDGSTFWVHQGCRMRFETLGSRLFLQLAPSWLFTSDGKVLLAGRQVSPLSIAWTARERNGAILRHVLFWAEVLANRGRSIEIPTGGQPLVLAPRPTRTVVPVGVACDFVKVRTLLQEDAAELDRVAEVAVFINDEEADDE